MLRYAFNRNLTCVGKAAKSSRNLNQIAQGRDALQLVHRRSSHRTRYRCQRSNRRDVENVAGLEPDVLRLVPLDQQIVEVEIRDRSAVSPHLDMSQRSLSSWSPRRKNRID